MTDIYLPLLVGATVHFAQPDALRVSCSFHFPAKILGWRLYIANIVWKACTCTPGVYSSVLAT